MARAHIVYGSENLRQQIALADVVARARILDADAVFALDDPPLRRPVVDAELLEVLKGDAKPGAVRFAQHGHGVAEFSDGDEVLLFLRRIERSRELDDARITASIRWFSAQEHDAAYRLTPASRKAFVDAVREYRSIEAIRDPEARLTAQRRVTLAMLLSDEPRLAGSALQDLAQVEEVELVTPEAVPVLVARVRDPGAPISVRVGLLSELERRSLVAGPPLWVELLGATRGADRIAAIRAAGRRPGPEVTSALIQLLGGDDLAAARAAAVALGTPGNAAAVAPLAKALDSPDEPLRLASIRGLGRVATPEARAVLDAAARSHPDPATRRRARAEATLLARAQAAPQTPSPSPSR